MKPAEAVAKRAECAARKLFYSAIRRLAEVVRFIETQGMLLPRATVKGGNFLAEQFG